MVFGTSTERTSKQGSCTSSVWTQQKISIEKARPKYLNELEALEKHGWLTAASAMLLFSTEYAIP